ncbi:MAG TPA: cytochrome c [Polyangiales bacterium]|jgi:mono/diheme cytochrome c family protein|nr:cytochrome c [Polyangiales bacterium]
MSQAESAKVPVVPVAVGTVVGLMMFAGLSFWFGRPFIPTVEDLPTYPKPAPVDPYAALGPATPAGPTDPGEQVFVSVCATCHQADAKGLAGTFPPLAGSSWVAGDPETPIRIVIEGLTGPIEVNGGKFASLMPPPPGVSTDDEKIAAVLTFVRSHFGNQAGAVTKEQVAAVRASLSGRTKNFTAEELTALRPAGGGAAAPAPAPEAAPGAAPAAAPAAPK